MMQLSKTFSNLKQALLRSVSPKYPRVDPFVLNVDSADTETHSSSQVTHVDVESQPTRGMYVAPTYSSSNVSLGTSSPASSYNPSIFTHRNPSISTMLTVPSPSPESNGKENEFVVLSGRKLAQAEALELYGNNSGNSQLQPEVVDVENVDEEYLPEPNFGLFRFNSQYDGASDFESDSDNELDYYSGDMKGDQQLIDEMAEYSGVKEVIGDQKTRRCELWDCVDGPIPSPLGFTVVVPSRMGGNYRTPTRSFTFGVGMFYFKPLVKHLAEETGRSQAEDIVLVSKVHPGAIHDQRSLDIWVRWSNGRAAEDRTLWVL